MKPDAAMLFAAGLGTRMAPLTNTRPKGLIPVAGKALIDHAVELVTDADIGTVVVNAHYLHDQIVSHFEGSDIDVVIEHDELLETGGGLKNALPHLHHNPVFTINTDAVWSGPNPLNILSGAWREEMEGLLLLVEKKDAIGHKGAGSFAIGANGKLSHAPEDIYTGVQIIRTELLENINETAFSMWRLWDQMLDRGMLYGVRYPGGWCDVGQPESIRLAEDFLRGRS